MKEFFLYELIM